MIQHKAFLLIPAIFLLLLSACYGDPGPTEYAEINEVSSPATLEPASTVEPTVPADEIISEWVSQFEPLPPEPQEVTIPVLGSSRELAGLYFPAKMNPAPIIIFMNGAGGSKSGWEAIALWLQNRDGEVEPGSDGLWRDPRWFPKLDANASFAVLTFDYHSNIGNYRADSQAAVIFASTLDGVDASQILTAGSSIGADSAPEACAHFNQAVKAGEAQGKCKGAFSFAPASRSFYADAAPSLLADGVILYCLASTGDTYAERACASQTHDNFHPYIFDGEAHDMYLIDPSLFPSDPLLETNSLDIFLEFLEQVTGLLVAAK